MHGCNIYTSNSLEILSEQLARIVKASLPSPVSPEIIVVQSRGMERWVSLELAKHNGICANCSFLFPNLFLQEFTKKLIPNLADDSLFDPDTMTFRIMKILPSCIHLPGFESLEKYLLDDIYGMQLYQISQRIADLFDQYLVFRPEMILSWEKGAEKHWQAQLWRKLYPGEENLHRARLRNILFKNIRKRSLLIEDFPKRVSIFGISYLPPFHLEAFIEIARCCRVNLFLMNPCREYWADIISEREKKTIRKKHLKSNDIDQDLYLEEGNRLLASMGTLGRNFFSMISGLDCRTYELFNDNHCNTILSKVQSDILNLKNRFSSLPSDLDTSIQIHSCHSPMREIEVLHDNLLSMFEEDPDLLPKDIVVMTPDIESYAPFIQAVFDAQSDEKLRIPFTISDRTVIKESRIIDGFMSILDLKNSRLSASCILSLLEFSEIKKKFDINESEIEIIEHWIKETNIRWGIDAQYRRKKGLPGFSENTWKTGIDRLFLGYAMPGFGHKMFSGILPYDHIEGSEAKILGKLMRFLDSIFKCTYSLDQARKLSGWHVFLNEIIDRFFAPQEDSEREIQILRHILDEMQKKEELSGFDKSVELEIIRSYLERRLNNEQFPRGFIAGGVTFCAMLPMRSIPFKIVCLVGMNNEAFPRDVKTLGFDLMVKNPRIGDRIKRNDDKYLFLEALISARNRFYISYVGQSIQDNVRIPPSVLISEFIDYIKEGFGLSEEHIVTFHRLQAFSAEYYKPDSNLFSYSRENFSACCRRHKNRDVSPFITTRFSDPDREWKHLAIKDLSLFFTNPARFLLEGRLGIYFSETESVADEKENFNLDPLGKYIMDQELITKKMSGLNLKDYFPVKKASGQLPLGNVGKFVYNETSLDAEDFIKKIDKHLKNRRLYDRDFALDVADFGLSGRIHDVYEYGTIQVRYVKIKPKYLLNTWIYHLILCVLNEPKNRVRSLLLCKDAAREFKPVSNAIDTLRSLLRLYWKGISEPLYFFPESSFEYVKKILLNNQTRDAALNAAQIKWIGSDFIRGESKDPYFELCFSKTDPLDEIFEKIAKKIFIPLLNHCSEIVL